MRKLAAVTVLLVALAPVPASGDEPLLAGELCEMASAVSADGNDWTVVVSGGPLSAADVRTVQPDPGQVVEDNPVSVTLTCSIMTSGYTYAHQPDDQTSSSGAAVAVVPPTPLTYHDPAGGKVVAVCSQVTVVGKDSTSRHYYWDNWAQRFSTDPATPCEPLICPASATGSPCDEPFYWQVLRDALDAAFGVVDPAVCEVFRELPDYPGVIESADDGDLYVNGEFFWDCPPYAH